MKTLPFTQYLPPNARKQEISVEVNDETGRLGQELLDAGYVLEAEILRTGQVSLTVADPEAEVDVGIEITPNDDRIHDAVRRLIEETHARVLK